MARVLVNLVYVANIANNNDNNWHLCYIVWNVRPLQVDTFVGK